MIKLKDLLSEDTIANIVQDIKIVLKVDKTNHASDRQSRHGLNGEDFISDKEILITAKKALPKISNMLLFNKMDIGDTVLIKNTSTFLNLVGAIEEENKKLQLIIITVMTKRDFKPKAGNKIIYV